MRRVPRRRTILLCSSELHPLGVVSVEDALGSGQLPGHVVGVVADRPVRGLECHVRATRQLRAIGPPPHLDAEQFSTRVRWVANFGGVTTNANYRGTFRTLLVSLLRSPDYSLPDVIRTVRGLRTTQAALLPQLAATDLVHTMPRIDVPIVIVQGRLDEVAPGEAAQRFYDAVAAPHKELVWFDRSAHTPHLEEPQRFRDVLMDVRARHVASTRAR